MTALHTTHSPEVESLLITGPGGRATLTTYICGQEVETLAGRVDGSELVLDVGQDVPSRRVKLPEGGAA